VPVWNLCYNILDNALPMWRGIRKGRVVVPDEKGNLAYRLVAWIYRAAEREPEPRGMVRPAKLFLRLALVFALIALIPGVLLPKNGVYGILACICWICFIPFCVYIWHWFFCSVIYDQKGFGYKSLLGKQHFFSYDDITGISVNDENIILHIGKDQVVIGHHDKGKDTFLNTVNAWYGLSHEGRPVPSITVKNGFLKGNVQNPVAYFVGRLFLLAFFVALFLYAYFQNTPYKESDLKYKTIVVESCQMEEGQMRIYTAEDAMYYRIRDCKKLLNTEQMDYLLKSSDLILEVGFATYRDADPPFYEVADLKTGSADVSFSLEEVNRLRREDSMNGLMIIGALTVVWIGYLLVALYVGRNAEKCSKRVFHFFFPKDKHPSEKNVPETQAEDTLIP